MSKRRKNAGEGYGYMFHGAFAKKADAVAKEKKTKGAWVKGTPTNRGYRYLVMSPRTNPRKRKNSVAWGSMDRKISLKEFRKLLREHGYGPDAAVRGATRAQAEEMIRRLDETHRKYSGQNPMDLIVMGANPGGEAQEIVARPGQTIHIRVNPSPLASSSDDSHYMRQAAAELFGKALEQLTARELSRVAMRAAQLKLERMRANGLGDWLGWAPGRPATARERSAHRREWKTRVRATAKEMGDEYKRMRRSARGSFKDKHKLEALFHEVYGQNPAERCGARIGRYVCSRKPGHAGPHLPQGATLRPRSRHNWGRSNPSAEAIREDFTGMEVNRVSTYREAHMPAGNYALLGKLLALYVKPYKGGQVQMIKATGGTLVVSDESARQIYFVGGDQDLSAALSIFGAIDRGAGLFELGEARRIDYKQRKEHVPDPDVDEWRHEFGEESGVRPKVLFDANHKRLLLEGGEYEIRPEGIVN